MRKFGGLLLAGAMALSVGLISGPAGAAAAGPQCAALTTKTVGSKVSATVSKCTPATATGGSGSGVFTASTKTSGSFNITLTWVKGHGTTKGVVKFGPSKGLGKCAAGTSSRLAITGSVTGGTGTAVKTIKAGQKVTASVCIGKTADTLEPGTVMKI